MSHNLALKINRLKVMFFIVRRVFSYKILKHFPFRDVEAKIRRRRRWFVQENQR